MDIEAMVAEVVVEGLHHDGWTFGRDAKTSRWGWMRDFGHVTIVTDADTARCLVVWAENGVFPTSK